MSTSAASKTRGGRRRLRRWAVLLMVLAGAWWTCLYFVQRSLLYPLSVANGTPTMPPPAGVEVLRLPLGEGAVEAWYAAAPGAGADEPAALVLYFHGNAQRMDEQAHVIAGYLRLGVSVLIPEYRGYGRSAGAPSQAGIGDDMRRWVEVAKRRPEVDAGRIIYHGRSVGAGVACDLARTHAPAAMILETPFVSVRGMSWRFLAPPLLVRDPYDNAAAVRGATYPLLIFAAARDDVIGVADAERLRDLAPPRRVTYVAFAATHNGFPGGGDAGAYWEAVGALVGQSEEPGALSHKRGVDVREMRFPDP